MGVKFGASILDVPLPEDGKTRISVASPLDDALAEPVKTDELRIIVNGALTNEDARAVADYASQYRRIALVVGMRYNVEPFALDFLTHFPFLTRFDLLALDFDRFQELELLPRGLTELDLGNTRSKRLSLRILERFPDLRILSLEAHTKDIEALSSLVKLEDLTLRSITLPDLKLLLPMKKLASLDIKLGGTRDLRLLPRIGRLKYLELWMIKALDDVSMIGEMTALQYLFMQSLKHVRNLPSLRNLSALRRVDLEQMSGICDLTPIAEAPNLEDLMVSAANHLRPEHFRPFLGHPTLRRVGVGLGSFKKNAEVGDLLKLPPVLGQFTFH